MKSEDHVVVGVDATNLRAGGGRTHLIELLSAAQPERFGISRVIVWGDKKTIGKVPVKNWLELESPKSLNGGTVRRLVWQRFCLARAASQAGCHILFVPGGSFSGGFRPVVTMSRNMLPFEWCELSRYSFSLTGLRLLALRQIQSRTFRKADGIIFLNEYARKAICKVTGPVSGETAVIPHGRSSRFEFLPKPQQTIDTYSESTPFRIIYVSIVNHYKHQWTVVEAISELRKAGWFIQLDLVGPAYRSALPRLEAAIAKYDSLGTWVRYHGQVAYEVLHQKYSEADLGIFASSCENMPNILLEKMAAGLPIACSNRGPMPEILKDAGVYFDPEKPKTLVSVLQRLISSTELRMHYAQAAYEASQRYSWSRCASETFLMLSAIARGRDPSQSSAHLT